MTAHQFTGLATRVSGKGADAWEVHRIAQNRMRDGDDILILSIGEDVAGRTPDHIVDACVESVQNGRHHYSDMIGERKLREAIASHHRSLTGQELSIDNCVVFAGAQNALFATSACLLEEGDEVIVLEPYYSTYPATFTAGGAKMISLAARAENGFLPTTEEIEAALSSRTRAVVLNSPNNPSGAIIGEELVQAIIGLARKHDLWVLSDEVYSDFVFEGRHVSPAAYMEVEEKCVVISSLSKSHRMAGWRVGWAIGAAALCETYERLGLCMMYGMPMFTQDAATAALTGPQDETREMVADYGRRAKLVETALSDLPGLRVNSPKAGMFMMLDVRDLTPDSKAFSLKLLEQSGISTLPCASFGDSVQGFVRMSLCASEAKLDWACGEIARLVKGWS